MENMNIRKTQTEHIDNTNSQMEFMAGSFWDCAQYCSNQGCGQISDIMKHFELTVNIHIKANRIDPKQYSKFKEAIFQMGHAELFSTKEEFLATFKEYLSYRSGLLGNGEINSKLGLEEELNAVLDKYLSRTSKDIRKILVYQLMASLSHHLCDMDMSLSYRDKIEKIVGLPCRLKGVEYRIDEGDGCSGSTAKWGKLL